VPTLRDYDENVDHRLCVKHLYGNFRKRYPGDTLKQALWAAARSSTVSGFNRAMEHLKTLNEAAWEEMTRVPPQMWARAHYSTHTHCDLQVNNMCEAFNKAILEEREKPIISMLEGLKFYLNNRIVKQGELMLRWKRSSICPMIQQKLEEIKKESDKWSANWSGDDHYALFEVSKDTSKYVVNLTERTCACRRWDLSGIPCKHVIAFRWFNIIS
jgi:hypothetical protein